MQSLISRLRKALRGAGIDDALLQSQPTGYRLALADDAVDVHRFAALAAAGRAELRAGRPAEAAMTLRTAGALCRGSPLAGILDAPFAAPALARLAEERLTAWSKVAIEIQHDEMTPQLAALELVAITTAFDEAPLDDLAGRIDRTIAVLEEHDAIDKYPVVGFLQPMLMMFVGRIEDAMAAARRLSANPDPWTRAFARVCVCFIAQSSGDMDTATEALAESLETLREIGERWAMCFALSMDGSLRSLRGDYDGAIRAHEEALGFSAELGSTDDSFQQHAHLARVRMMSGDFAGAERDSQYVLDHAADLDGTDRGDIEFFIECGLIRLKCMLGDAHAAREHLALAHTHPTSVPISARGHRMASLMMAKACMDELDGDLDAVRADLVDALRSATTSPDVSLLASVGERIARLVLLTGDRAVEAAGVLGASAALRGLLDQGDPDVRDTIDALAAQLGEDGYATAFRAGRDLDRAAAVLALHTALGVSPELSTQD